MPRHPRITFPDAFYHVMNRGAGRRVIFKNDEQRKSFVALLERVSLEYQAEIHAYCLMDNHFHILLRTPLANISEIMHYLTITHARKFNRSERTDGPVFRARFKAIVIDADDYLVKVSRYIHLNPVKAKLCSNPAEYPWSSYSAYIDADLKQRWLHTGEVLRRLGSDNQRATYSALVENPALPSLDKFYQHGCLPSVLGTKEFKRYLLSSMNISTDVNDQRIEERDALVNRVAAYFNECADDVIETQQGKSKLARLVAIHLSKTHCKQRNSMISAWFGITDSAVSVSLKRFSKAS